MSLGVHSHDVEHQGCQHTGAVLARRTVEDQRVVGALTHQDERLGQCPSAHVQIPEVPLGQIVPGRCRHGLAVRLPSGTLPDDGEMVVADRFRFEGAPARPGQFAGSPQIDDGGQAERTEGDDVGRAQLVEGIAPEQPAPSGDTTARGRIPAQVAEVERPLQGDEPFGRFHALIMVDRSSPVSRHGGTDGADG